jgi:hypothetical protein
MSSYIIGGGFPGSIVIVTQADGTIAAVPGFPISTGAPAQAASTALHVDLDTLYTPAIANLDRTLQAAFVTDSDTVYATVAVPYLLPARVTDADSIFAADVKRVSGQGTQHVRPAGAVNDVDTIFAPNVQNIRLELRPQGVVPADDAVYAFTNTRFAQAPLVSDSDTVPAADVGWKVFATFTTDVDAIYSNIGIKLYNDVLPDVWMDEETIDGYPFRVQSITGGIPVPEREQLTGSLGQRRVLTGSLTRPIRLKGSIRSARRLTGSLRSVHYGNKKR